MYRNLQLTEYYNYAGDDEMSPVFYAKFSLSNTPTTLVAIEYGGVTPYNTIVLCSVSSQGVLVDALDVQVISREICTRQFRINAENRIMVTTIYPLSSDSLPFSSVFETEGFYGFRQDDYYYVDSQGMFRLERCIRFEPMYYQVGSLVVISENHNRNLWQGNEVPISE